MSTGRLRSDRPALLGWLLVLIATTAGLARPMPVLAQADATAEYNTVVSLYQAQRWTLAARNARKFLSDFPSDPKAPLATLYLGQSLSQTGQHGEARDVFRGFLKSYPNHSNAALARYRVGEASHFLKDDAAAVESLERYLRTAPDGTLANYARLYLGKSLTAVGRGKQALGALQTMLRTEGIAPDLEEEGRLELARAFAAVDRTDDAIAQLRGTLEKFPQGDRNDEVRLTLGSMLFEAEKFSEAREAFDALARLQPGSPLVATAVLNAGYAAYRAGQLEVALDRFETAGQTESQAATAAYWAGLTLKAAGRPADAVARLLDAYEAAPRGEYADRLLYQAAVATRDTGEVGLAIRRFREITTAFPRSRLIDDAVYNAADLLLQRGDLPAAETLLARFRNDLSESPLAPRAAVLAARVEMARMAADPETRRWWQLCSPCQRPLETRREGEWWAMMEEVFHHD